MLFSQLETERLVVRRSGEGDAEALVAYRNDPQVARFQAWASYSLAQALALVADQRFVENTSSIRLLERLGFSRPARLPAHFRQGEEWRDEYRWELSDRDWTLRYGSR